MNTTISPITDCGNEDTFEVHTNLGRFPRALLDLPGTLPTTALKHANRRWPTARGLVYVVDAYPGLAELAKMLLEMEGFSACAFEDRTEAWRAFAFANPHPALLITDNLHGDEPAIKLIKRCRSLEPRLKTLLVEHQASALSESETDLINGRLSLPYCGPLLVAKVRRLCPGGSGRNRMGLNKFGA